MVHVPRHPWLAGLLALGLASCSAPPAGWQLISPLGWPITNHRPGALLFLDDSTGLLLGSAWSQAAQTSGTITQEQVSTIFRTTDGGRHWQMRALGKGSRFEHATRAGAAAYAVERRCGSADTSRVLRSIDGGATWQFLGQVPGRVRSISFADTSQGLLLVGGTTRPGTLLYRSTDGGRRWRPADLRLPAPARSALHTPDGTPWLLLAPGSDTLATQLARVDWARGRATPEHIPGGRIGAAAADAAGHLWLASSGNGVRLLRRDQGSGRYTEVRRFPAARGYHMRAVGLHVAGPGISLLTASVGAPARLAFFRFHHSPDGGRSWREEPLPKPAAALPYAFFGPDHVWLAAGPTRLQVRRPGP